LEVLCSQVGNLLSQMLPAAELGQHQHGISTHMGPDQARRQFVLLPAQSVLLPVQTATAVSSACMKQLALQQRARQSHDHEMRGLAEAARVVVSGTLHPQVNARQGWSHRLLLPQGWNP
jgi:hypothetical protein